MSGINTTDTSPMLIGFNRVVVIYRNQVKSLALFQKELLDHLEEYCSDCCVREECHNKHFARSCFQPFADGDICLHKNVKGAVPGDGYYTEILGDLKTTGKL